MKCESAWELLSASLDGALAPAEEETLQAHLKECPRCRALQAELMGIHTACGELDAALPAGQKERILSALPSQTPSKSRHWQRWGAMAAVLALVAMAAWRLPHYLYDKPTAEPQGDETTAVTTGSTETNAASTAIHGADNGEIYFKGRKVDLNQGDGNPGAPFSSAEVPLPHDFATASTSDLAADTTEEISEQGQADVAEYFDSDAEIAPVSLGARMAPVPTENGVFSGGGGDAVPEVASAMKESELYSAAQSLEPVAEVADALATYCGVLTLDAYQPEADYPALLLESGEVWYSLPAQDFAELIQTLDEAGQSYELRLSGEDISPDAPEGLVIVPTQVP